LYCSNVSVNNEGLSLRVVSLHVSQISWKTAWDAGVLTVPITLSLESSKVEADARAFESVGLTDEDGSVVGVKC